MTPERKIAIVDDNRETLELLRFILERRGFTVLQASSGLRLLSMLEVDRPDLILLDVMMSWIDGFDLCRALKTNPQYREIPVCFISALGSDEHVRQGMACGAAAYFTKPFDVDAMLETVTALSARPR